MRYDNGVVWMIGPAEMAARERARQRSAVLAMFGFDVGGMGEWWAGTVARAEATGDAYMATVLRPYIDRAKRSITADLKLR